MKKKLNCVLLVDDNDSDNFLHRRVLEKAGITERIEIVENGQEAINFLASLVKPGVAENPAPLPDIIFLDINMPVMDGWEFLDEYEKLETGDKSGVVIIILTTSSNPADKAKAHSKLGVDRFRFKPLTPAMLEEVLEKHFPQGYSNSNCSR
jgi:CheY-like chemotaxis protein